VPLSDVNREDNKMVNIHRPGNFASLTAAGLSENPLEGCLLLRPLVQLDVSSLQ
jgi:hypothetical protein